MKIFKPVIIEDGNEVCVSARVEVDSTKSELPEELWFRFPISCKDYVSDHLNGFAVALLPLAMTFGEDMYLEGVFSPRLLRGMEEYQRIQCTWKPTFYKPVKFECDHLQASEVGPEGPGVGCSFSAGVDSFISLWRHLPQNEPIPEYRVSHGVIINGFDPDSDLENEGHFGKIQKSIRPIFEEHGLGLIVCQTNFMSFCDPRIGKLSFATLVVSPALILGRLFSTFYVPSSYRFNEFYRDGSHLLLDHLLSTESMQTIHDSSHLNRPEKTAIISNWSATYSRLRVCFNPTGYKEDTGSIMNCSRCEKCVRTMITLEIQGQLDKYSCFSKKPGHLDVWKCDYGYKGSRVHAREVMSLAWKAGRWGIWIDYCIAIAVSLLIKLPRLFLQHIHLFLEERSEFYAVNIRRLFPRLRRRAYWIR